jgi:hypothetical protein
MKKISSSFLVLGIFSLAVTGLTGILQSAKADDDEDRADRIFSVRDLRGNYSVQLDGFVPPTAPSVTPTPVSILGRFTADGTGKAKGSRTLIITGQPIPITASFECDYTVNADGTGKLTCLVSETNQNITPPTPIKRIDTFNLVLDRRGAEARLLLQNGLPAPGFPAIPGLTVIAGAPVSGSAVRQP